jgi:hypothetical protein
MAMRLQLLSAIIAATFAILAGVAPLDARTAARCTAPNHPRGCIAPRARPVPMPAKPPTGYCMTCLPPPYEWPHGGAPA